MALINYLWVFLLTFIPFLELRYSIPIGIFKSIINLPFGFQIIGYGLNPLTVFLVAVLANFLVAIILYFIFDKIHKILLKTKIINKIYERKIERVQRQIHPKIEKYGTLGLALFIAIPLPGSGVYSGALVSYLLGMKFKEYAIASLIGVIIAGIIVTLISLLTLGIIF